MVDKSSNTLNDLILDELKGVKKRLDAVEEIRSDIEVIKLEITNIKDSSPTQVQVKGIEARVITLERVIYPVISLIGMGVVGALLSLILRQP